MRLRCLTLLVWAIPALGWTQTTTAVDHYELGIFRSDVSMVTPFSVTQYPAALYTCGHPKDPTIPDADNGVPNPTKLYWDDPANPANFCTADARAPVLALPLGVNYKAGLRAVDAAGHLSSWAFTTYTFRRAPRGLPCPGGLPGVLVSGEADLNGEPVSITICVQH